MTRITAWLLAALAAGAGSAATPPAEARFTASDRCLACHNGVSTPAGEDISIGAAWQGSMMANAARDPYWQATVRREVMEHPAARAAIEDKCAACHMPMARLTAAAEGRAGAVFAHLRFAPGCGEEDALAVDGVSCAMCHQITAAKLGTRESFSAGFTAGAPAPSGADAVFGPFEIDRGRARVMRSSSTFEPVEAAHLQKSAFCAVCHTLFTESLGPDGEVLAVFPEQVPYLEWRHSAYRDAQECQSCHMPEVAMPAPVASVLARPHPDVSRHVFRGGNFQMARIFNLYRRELNVAAAPGSLAAVEHATLEHLSAYAARVSIGAPVLSAERLDFEVVVENLAGHKLPTAYPSRRAWLMTTVRDRTGKTVFASGALNEDGSIAGNDNDADGGRYEPHYREVTRPDQVQTYETIMADQRGAVTTGLLSAVGYVKDNRLLPEGFDKAAAGKDIAVRGAAAEDPDFKDGGDKVRYSAAVDPAGAPFTIEAALWYQSIGFRWAHNLAGRGAAETDRFVECYRATARHSATKLAADQRTAP